MEWKGSKGRSGPIPGARIKKAAYKLELALAAERNHSILKNSTERKPWEVTVLARDEAVEILRFLKIWYDTPSTIFFTAVHCLDGFLARMKVQERFLPCVTISCFNVAAELYGHKLNASQLVMLTQSRCSVKDMQRMSLIIKQKLGLYHEDNDDDGHYTVLDLLEVLLDLVECVAIQFNIEALLNTMLKRDELMMRLEVLMMHSTTALYKPSMITHAFIRYEMERFLSNEIPNKSNYYTMEMFYLLAVMIELHSLCKMDPADYASCSTSVTEVLKDYDDMKRSRHCQTFMWRYSSSTLAHLAKHSQNFYSSLKSIEEQ